MLESIAKKTKGILPILWIVQQLCLCFLLCNMLHMHQDSEETRPSVSLNRHGSDPCHEKHHWETCRKNDIPGSNRKADPVSPDDIVPFHVAVFSHLESGDIPYFSAMDSLQKRKLFLKLQNLRC